MKPTISTLAGPKPRRSMLLLLVILFVISYSLITMLEVQQGRTIDSQRSLIHLLFQDSIQLSALGKRKVAVQRPQREVRTSQSDTSAQAQVQSPQVQSPQAQPPQTPLSQAPSAQLPQAQTGPDQTRPQPNPKAGRNSRKAAKPLPARPPVELTDPSDMRRVTFSI